jgi:hypothetical protein
MEKMVDALEEEGLIAGEPIVADCAHIDEPRPSRLVQQLG